MNLKGLQYTWWNLYNRDLLLRGSEFLVRAFRGTGQIFFDKKSRSIAVLLLMSPGQSFFQGHFNENKIFIGGVGCRRNHRLRFRRQP